MKIAVIGAGMSGLGAMRTLVAGEHEVTGWDKGASVGGRVGTRRLEEAGGTLYFDHGAQNIKSEGSALENVLADNKLCQRVLVEPPVCLHENKQVLPPDPEANAQSKWSCPGGMRNLPRALAMGLDIRIGTRIERIVEDNRGFSLFDSENRVLNYAERVVLSIPAPQAADLLEKSEWECAMTDRIALLRTVEYSRCLSVLLRFPVGSDDLDFYALLARDRSHPLLWLARENSKPGFVPEANQTALIAQLGHETSCRLWDRDDNTIVNATTAWIQEIDGRFHSPDWSFVKRWRYSQPLNTINFDEINAVNSRLVVCGDATARGRVPDAWDSGVRAAQLLLTQSL